MNIEKTMNKVVIIMIYVLVSICNRIECQSYEEMDSLIGRLFNASRYNRNLRPLRDQKQIMQVNLTNAVNYLLSYDTQTSSTMMFMHFQLTWYDELLIWNPDEYNDLDSFVLPDGLFWSPDIVMLTSLNIVNNYITVTPFSHSYVTHNGRVVLNVNALYEYSCYASSELYPFDRHMCAVILAPANHAASTLQLVQTSGSPNIHKSAMENEEWNIEVLHGKGYNSSNGSIRVSVLENIFIISRRPMFEVLQSILPIVLLSASLFATFFIPVSSGEKLSYTVTVYLALMLVSSTVMDKLPRNALKLTIPCIMVVIVNCIGTFILIWTVLVVNVFSIPKIETHRFCVFNKLVQRNGSSDEMQQPASEECEEIKNDDSESRCRSGLDLAATLNKVGAVFVIVLAAIPVIYYFVTSYNGT